jgi:XRE family aerobic/anaerobic benzoate catabolism transcriptional regulator
VTTIASRLREAREARKLTQPALAKLAEVSQGTVGNIEAGSRQGSAVVLHKLASALRVRFEWLLEGETPMDLPTDRDATALHPGAVKIAKRLDKLAKENPTRFAEALRVCEAATFGVVESQAERMQAAEVEERESQPSPAHPPGR